MLNTKKHNKIALAVMGILSVGTVLCLLGFKPLGAIPKPASKSQTMSLPTALVNKDYIS